ncbi:MAG: transcriptional regulator [Candidatus Altiarchaeales archaeon]|nr:transcriptional regulator [Candidatus Altiarchaeales archaeon]MBD3417026.1 transcriptional regulator [Candidatus Altiarchaeales archaeon]
MKKDEPMSAEEFCPIRQTIKLLGKRWTILIVKEIYFGKGRKLGFMELRRRLPDVSTKVLSERLKEMAEAKLVRRKEHRDSKPVRVTYTLTDKGKDACEILKVFKGYGLKWGGKDTFNCGDIDCELCPRRSENEED